LNPTKVRFYPIIGLEDVNIFMNYEINI